jgi:TolB protein
MASDGTGFEEHAIENGYGALAWSPTGDRLLVWRGGLFLASLDGAELSQVTPGATGPPDWSSTGQIAFSDFPSRSCYPACFDIYLTRLGGSPRRLTFRGGYSPSWSPHGTKLAFVRFDHNPGADDREIYIVRRNGRGLHRFTRRSGGGPSWSPDGQGIAFIRHGSLYLASSTGGHLRRVVKGFADALGEGEQVVSVDWQPLPRRLASGRRPGRRSGAPSAASRDR